MKKHISAGALLLASILGSIVVAEITLRALEGLPIFALHLPDASAVSEASGEFSTIRKYMEAIPKAKGVSAGWFEIDPPYRNEFNDITPSLLRYYKTARARLGSISFEVYKQWNANFLEHKGCKENSSTSKLFARFPSKQVFAYAPKSGGVYPAYRYIPGTLTPERLRANNFGWRGPDLPLNKPDGVVRIAFAGASTTVHQHGYPYSYPEFIGVWLNLWAKATNAGVRFETINIGREGISSPDIAAIVRDELLPVEPDMVLYYEGANEFNPRPMLTMPDDVADSAGQSQMAAQERTVGPLERYEKHSAIARRVDALYESYFGSSGEPPKPDYRLNWPDGVDEMAPSLEAKNLPLNLSNILIQLRKINANLKSAGAELVMTSFLWLPQDGMRLDPVRHKSIHEYLNVNWHPFRYRDIARLARFQNRVYRAFAQENGLKFIDIAKLYPKQPELFTDGVHQTYEGVRLRAWLVFQQIIPIISEKLEKGLWPRKGGQSLSKHPMLDVPVFTVRVNCNRNAKNERREEKLDLSAWRSNNTRAQVIQNSGGAVTVKTAASPHYYAAEYILPEKRSGNQAAVSVRVKPKSGGFILGILSRDRSKFLYQKAVDGNETKDATLSYRFGPGEARGAVLLVTSDTGGTAAELDIVDVILSSQNPRNYEIIGSGVIIPETLKKVR